MYPRPSDRRLGIFVAEEVKELSKWCKIKVVAPIPWFLPLKFFKKWHAYTRIPRREIRNDIEVFRPRTLIFPKTILFSLLGFTFFISLLQQVRGIENSFGFDLIHAHAAYPDGFATVLVSRILNRPVVVTLHGSDVTLILSRYLWRRLGLWGLSNADRIIAVSSSLREKVLGKHVVEGSRVTVIPNGVDVNRFEPIPRAEALETLGLQDEVFKILYVGAIKEPKGIEYLLKATKRLVKTVDRRVELFLVGEGQYKREAKLLADKLGVSQMVHFVGQKPNQEIPLWMNTCDVLVLPSLSEGFGVVLIEAMACGKPVISTKCGGPEDIVSQDTGILVPPRDEAALSNALKGMLNGRYHFDPERIRQYVIDNYAYDRIASRILEVYRQALHD
jgi:teichuronic acid biosynthesis glycosyltransferase TuaC